MFFNLTWRNAKRSRSENLIYFLTMITAVAMFYICLLYTSENVDIFASLDAIMRQNTGFFQSDFDIAKEIIEKAAASPNREDKTCLLYTSRCV